MVHLKQLEFHNFGRYRGKHQITLQPGVYAVTAQAEDNPDRSNWFGKSTFLSAIPFLLTGWQHFSATESGWISTGEKEGGVRCVLSDGTEIARTRVAGQSTQLAVRLPDGRELHGAAAQEEIEDRYGVNQTDLFVTSFFRQKHLSRFVIEQPSKRMEIVTSWLNELVRLQRAADRASELALQAEQRVLEVKAERQQCEEVLLDIGSEQLAAHGAEAEAKHGCEELLAASIEEVKGRVEVAREALQKVNEERATAKQSQEVLKRAAEFDQLNIDGVVLKNKRAELADDYDSVMKQSTATADELKAQVLQVRAEHATASKVASAQFDGSCPVDGYECPAKAAINGRSGEAREKLPGLAEELERKSIALREAEAAYREAHNSLRERDRIDVQLDTLRQRAKELQAYKRQARAIQIAEDLDARVAEAHSVYSAAVAELARRELQLATYKKTAVRITELDGELYGLEFELKVARTVCLVLGRNGTQRRIAEGAMAQISEGANALLQQAGIPLTIDIVWAKEGDGKATACHVCGAPFPKSAKVKQCECGATRGPKMVEKLDIELSDRSGAAEDLAGIAIQLSASAWLRGRRGIQWGVACIDEPFGALDEANRKDLALQLATMLQSRYGYEQAFIVSHSRDINEALPNRVALIADSSGTRFLDGRKEEADSEAGRRRSANVAVDNGQAEQLEPKRAVAVPARKPKTRVQGRRVARKSSSPDLGEGREG